MKLKANPDLHNMEFLKTHFKIYFLNSALFTIILVGIIYLQFKESDILTENYSILAKFQSNWNSNFITDL
jgi:hypothetical protein